MSLLGILFIFPFYFLICIESLIYLFMRLIARNPRNPKTTFITHVDKIRIFACPSAGCIMVGCILKLTVSLSDC